VNEKTPRKMPHVGIFWLVQTPNGELTLLAAGCPLDQAEPYGDCLTYSPGHYKTWAHWRRDKTVDPALRALVQAYEYEDWPRGRIVFERARDLFIIYADRKLPTTPQREYASDQTNGICERFHKTVLNEFYRVAFRKRVYRSIDELQADLDVWIREYNEQRPHQGRWCFGKTPNFLDAMPMTKEKMIAA
jgi:Integrase core domain